MSNPRPGPDRSGWRHLDALTELSLEAPGEAPLEARIPRILAVLRRGLGAERVAAWRLDGQTLGCVAQEPALEAPEGGDEPALPVLQRKQVRGLLTAIAASRSFSCEAPARNPRTKELAGIWWEPRGVKAAICAAVRLNGELRMVLTCSFRGEASLKDADRAFAAAVADQVALSIGAAERRALEQALGEARGEERGDLPMLFDPVTGLAGEALYLDRVERALRRSLRHPELLFAALSVTPAGVEEVPEGALLEIARRLESCLRPADTAARLADGSFALLIDPIGHESDANRVAARVQRELERPLVVAGRRLVLQAPVGIALSTSGYDGPRVMLRDAVEARGRAHQHAPGRIAVADVELDLRAEERLRLETELRRGVARQEFRVILAPIMALEGTGVVGFRAALSWVHPERGALDPRDALRFVRASGLGRLLGQWLLVEAARCATAWRETITLVVPVDEDHLRQVDFVDQVRGALNETGLRPARLVLSLSEAALDNATGRARVVDLGKLGVACEVDGFGAGRSSLVQLYRCGVRFLRLAPEVISDLAESDDALRLVHVLERTARGLHMQLVANGIRTASQAERLQLVGCRFGQGRHFGEALTPERATALAQ